MLTQEYLIEGMSCSHCVGAVLMSLSTIIVAFNAQSLKVRMNKAVL